MAGIESACSIPCPYAKNASPVSRSAPRYPHRDETATRKGHAWRRWRSTRRRSEPGSSTRPCSSSTGISRQTIEAHYKLYQGYVAKRNEILGKLGEADVGAANQVYSDIRALKVDLSFAIGGIKNHEIYFEHLGGDGGDPEGPIGTLVRRDFGSIDAWRNDLKATGMAGRGWAWTAYDWDEKRLFNYVGDAQNTFPIWNATPLVALDVYEHAYFLDFQTDRASYIDAFLANLDWNVVNGWIESYGIRP